MWGRAIPAGACVLIQCACIHQTAVAKPLPSTRSVTTSDIFRLEGISDQFGGSVALSPDEVTVAFAKIRALADSGHIGHEFLDGSDRSDVWIAESGSKEVHNLTDGERSRTGWWAPEWSPDGRYLAMVSTAGPGDARNGVWLWVWDHRTKILRRVCDDGIDLPSPNSRPYLWVGSQRILFSALPRGLQPLLMRIGEQTPEIATREWQGASSGHSVTASVVDGSSLIATSSSSHARLATVDVVTKQQATLVDADTYAWKQSPNGKYVAYAKRGNIHVLATVERLKEGPSEQAVSVGIADIDRGEILASGTLIAGVATETLRWSASSAMVAFAGFARPHGSDGALFFGDVSTRSYMRVDVPSLRLEALGADSESAQLLWAGVDGVVVRGTPTGAASGRRDWWFVSRDGSIENLTRSLPAPPDVLLPIARGDDYIAVANQSLWQISRTKHVSRRLAIPAFERAGFIPEQASAQGHANIVVTGRLETNDAVFVLHPEIGGAQELAMPEPRSRLIGLSPRATRAVFLIRDRTGLRLWSVAAKDQPPRMLAHMNAFLNEIEEAPLRPITYSTATGQQLSGWVMLPIGYRPGRRYPTIVWVYAGAIYGDTPPERDTLGFLNCLSMQIPAARGYAVLFPSMPFAAPHNADAPLAALPIGVLPAVDKAVELGIADEQQLFVMGQSFGGYSAYGLLAQTDVFKAAVASAAISNLVSLYGQFDARLRYSETLREHQIMPGMLEAGIFRMHSPPWREPARYQENSPVFFVDRINTPLMIVQGDLDYVPIQQGEEMFTALNRLGKPVRFVRYWGEGHVLRSPANVRDMWERVLAWFGGEYAAAQRNGICDSKGPGPDVSCRTQVKQPSHRQTR